MYQFDVNTSDKASGILASVFWLIRQAGEGGFDYPGFYADLIAAVFIALVSTLVSWSFRVFVLDKIKRPKKKGND